MVVALFVFWQYFHLNRRCMWQSFQLRSRRHQSIPFSAHRRKGLLPCLCSIVDDFV